MIFKHWLFVFIMGIFNIIAIILFIPTIVIVKINDYFKDDNTSCAEYWLIYIDAYTALLREIKDKL